MTYKVFGGTLSLTQLMNLFCFDLHTFFSVVSMLQVWPIVNHPEQELCSASEALLGDHERQFHMARIIMQVSSTCYTLPA